MKKLLLTGIMMLCAAWGYAQETSGVIGTQAMPAHEVFRLNDPFGYGMAVTAMLVVMTALFVLYLIFRALGKIQVGITGKKKKAVVEAADGEDKAAVKNVISGEIIAAIGLALRMYENDLHDNESTVLTLNRVAKAYSPWNSKLYGMTQSPNRIGKPFPLRRNQ